MAELYGFGYEAGGYGAPPNNIAVVLGQVSEADSARALSILKTIHAAQVTETDAPGFLTNRKRRTLTQPSETESAFALSQSAKVVIVIQVGEIDESVSLSASLSGVRSVPARPLGRTGSPYQLEEV